MYKTAKFKSEAEMAAHVVGYLHERSFEVFQEVYAVDGCADIVGRAGPLLWTIECKLQLNFEVIAQARRWIRHSHMVSIAVPNVKSRDDFIACEILEKMGLGFLIVGADGEVSNRCIRDLHKTTGMTPRDEALQRIYAGMPSMDNRLMGAPFRRKVLPGLGKSLHEAQKTFAAAGTASGKRWTPFKNTCDELRKHVEKTPGTTLKEAIGSITHHYTNQSSARGCLSRLIEEGVVEGVELRREGRQLYLYPTQS